VRVFCEAYLALVTAVTEAVPPPEHKQRGRPARVTLVLGDAAPSGGGDAADGGDAGGAGSTSAAPAKLIEPAEVRAKLEASGAAAAVPPSCRKALLANDRLKNLGRGAAHSHLAALKEHAALHAALTAARAEADAEFAAAEAAAAAGATPSKAKRRRWPAIAPRPMHSTGPRYWCALRRGGGGGRYAGASFLGWRAAPDCALNRDGATWAVRPPRRRCHPPLTPLTPPPPRPKSRWNAKHDDRLVWGSYLHGFQPLRATADSLEAILKDESLGEGAAIFTICLP
jgi:hypothetical protein